MCYEWLCPSNPTKWIRAACSPRPALRHHRWRYSLTPRRPILRTASKQGALAPPPLPDGGLNPRVTPGEHTATSPPPVSIDHVNALLLPWGRFVFWQASLERAPCVCSPGSAVFVRPLAERGAPELHTRRGNLIHLSFRIAGMHPSSPPWGNVDRAFQTLEHGR